jgi:hypothetical protein
MPARLKQGNELAVFEFQTVFKISDFQDSNHDFLASVCVLGLQNARRFNLRCR